MPRATHQVLGGFVPKNKLASKKRNLSTSYNEVLYQLSKRDQLGESVDDVFKPDLYSSVVFKQDSLQNEKLMKMRFGEQGKPLSRSIIGSRGDY